MSPVNTVVYQPDPVHRCDVGWTERLVTLPAPPPPLAGWPKGHVPAATPLKVRGQWDPAGTVRRCDECGRTWVAHKPDRVYSGQQSVGVQWRPEGWFARWRRERRQRAEPDIIERGGTGSRPSAATSPLPPVPGGPGPGAKGYSGGRPAGSVGPPAKKPAEPAIDMSPDPGLSETIERSRDGTSSWVESDGGE